MENVNFELSPELKAKLELKKLYALLGFSRKQIAEIEAKARKQKITSKQLMRKWILGHVKVPS